jgi:hypothetical protein
MGKSPAQAGLVVALLALRDIQVPFRFLTLRLIASHHTLHRVQNRPGAVTVAGEGAIARRGAFHADVRGAYSTAKLPPIPGESCH